MQATTSTGEGQGAKGGALPALTSLRFFAAMAVVLFHVPYVLPASVGRVWLPSGALGVSFFFILSGFILRHACHGQAVAPGEFYRRRAARILPLHYATLLVWIVLFFPGWGNALPEKMNSGIANILLLHAFFSGQVFTLGYNAVSWSISVEAFFYALFPLLVRGRRDIWLFAALVGIWLLLPGGTVRWLDQAFPNFFYFNPFGRLLEFVGGMVLHRLWCLRHPGWWLASAAQAASPILLLAMVPATDALPAHLRNLALLLPFGAIILAFAWPGLPARLLAWRGLVLLGEASFALYMTHHMLFRLLDPLLAGLAGPRSTTIIAVLAAVALSVAVFLLFERPARRLLARGQGVTPAPPRPKPAP